MKETVIPASREENGKTYTLENVVGTVINQDNSKVIYPFFNQVVEFLTIGVPLDRGKGYELPGGIISKIGNGLYQAIPFDSNPHTLSPYTLNILVRDVPSAETIIQKGRPVVYS